MALPMGALYDMRVIAVELERFEAPTHFVGLHRAVHCLVDSRFFDYGLVDNGLAFRLLGPGT